MAGPLPELSLREKVLLWLSHAEEKGRGERGVETTQAGIAHATGMSRGHVSRTLAPLLANQLLSEEEARLPGFTRLLKAYRLTASGAAEAERIGATLLKAVVETRRAGTEPAMLPLGEAIARSDPPPMLWDAYVALEARGHLDLSPAPQARGATPRFLLDVPEPVPGRAYVGRQDETAQFLAWLAEPAPRVLALEAPGGMGKTTFLVHALREGRPRMHVLWTRVFEGSKGSTLLARLGDALSLVGRPGAIASDGDAETLLEHLRKRVSGLPFLLVVDDVQKADASLRHVLDVVARLAATERSVRLVLVGRDVPLDAGLYREARRLGLRPLNDGESEELLAGLGASAASRGALVRAAHGNPLYLELLAGRRESADGSPDFAGFLVKVLAPALPAAEREVLAWMSALRTPAEPALLERLRIGSRAALDALARSSLLSVREDGLYEMHDVVREAFYAHVPYAERARIHERLARAFDPDGPTASIPEHLHHLVRAGKREEAVRWVLRNQRRLLQAAEELFTPEAA